MIVREMWRTGFDALGLHTMDTDKPMPGHGLMQAIARVNRVYMDKQGGLIVDDLGLADQFLRALSTVAKSGGQGKQKAAPQPAPLRHQCQPPRPSGPRPSPNASAPSATP